MERLDTFTMETMMDGRCWLKVVDRLNQLM